MTRRHPYLCLMVVAILGTALLVAEVGIVMVEHAGHPAPASLVAIGGGAMGALAAYLASVPPVPPPDVT